MKQILGIRKTIKSVFSVIYMIQVVLTIPLSFEVGGNECGLAFSLTICLLYGVLNTLRIVSVSHKRFKVLRFVFYLQHLFIPSLLIFFLSSYTTSYNFGSLYNIGVGVTPKHVQPQLYSAKLQNYFNTYILVWNFAIKNLTAVFIIFEGICSLLLIQAIGKSFTWLIYKSESRKNNNPSTTSSNNNEYKVLLNLLVSGTVLTISFYFLYNIFIIPNLSINLFSSTLLGSIITYCLGLSLFGILSFKGTLIESVLIFSYIVKCIYQTFPELTISTNDQINELITKTTSNFKKEFESNIFNLKNYGFSKNLFENLYHSNLKHYLISEETQDSLTKMFESSFNINYNSTMSVMLGNVKLFCKLLTLNLTNSFFSLFIFMVDAARYLTVLLVFNLAYRILVFYAATRIIPALKRSIKNGLLANSIVDTDLPELKQNMFSDDEDDVAESRDKVEKLYALEATPEPDAFSISSSSATPTPFNKRRSKKKTSLLAPSTPQPNSSSVHSKASRTSLLRTSSYETRLDKTRFIYSYSPCVIIAVYTNLMLLQRNEIDQNLIIWGWWMQHPDDWLVVNQIQFWNWLNMLLLLGLYTLELFSDGDD